MYQDFLHLFAFIGLVATIYLFTMTIVLGIKVFRNWLNG